MFYDKIVCIDYHCMYIQQFSHTIVHGTMQQRI